MPFINDYSTVSCLKKKYFFNKKSYPPIFDNFFNKLIGYKIKEKMSFPHFPQFFHKQVNKNF